MIFIPSLNFRSIYWLVALRCKSCGIIDGVAQVSCDENDNGAHAEMSLPKCLNIINPLNCYGNSSSVTTWVFLLIMM